MRKTPSGPVRGLRRVRVACLTAVAACAVSAIAVSAAQAVPTAFSGTFDDAALNLPDPVGTTDILDPPSVATMTGTVDPAAGNALSVPANQFVFPGFTGSAGGFPVSVGFKAIDNITGTATPTGDVHTDSSTYETTVVVVPGPSPLATCVYDSEESFSTGAGSPFNGDPFTVAPGPPITITNGIVQSGWLAGHFSPVSGGDVCNSILTPLINGGAGGVELGNGIDLTPAPPATTPPPTTPPPTGNPAALKKCIKKAKKKFKNNPAKKKKAIKKCKKKYG
jgi:hypothetical protein